MSVQHVVLLGFEPELDDSEIADMTAQVRSWPVQIGGFELLSLGPPISTARTRGYHFLLYMVFGDEESLDRYQVHPVHQRFARWVADHGGTALAFDYLLDADTVIVDAGAPVTPGEDGGADRRHGVPDATSS